jgi:hypothetical protein
MRHIHECAAINLHDLRNFLTVAGERRFTQAAAKLGAYLSRTARRSCDDYVWASSVPQTMH